MSQFRIFFYKNADGKENISAFIKSLNMKLKAKVYRELNLLKENGNDLREPHTKYLRDGIYELRIKQGSNIARILYFFVSGKKIILTNAFIKKSKNIPKQEFEKAVISKIDYEKNVEKEN